MIFFRNWLYLASIILLSLLLLGLRENDENSLTVVATGDTMLDSWAEMVISDSGYVYPFQYLSDYTSDADIFFTNLEAPFCASGKPFDKKFTFRVDPALVNVLRSGKINLVSLGNNHSMDYGYPCLQETMALLSEHNIHFAGAGKTMAEARKPAVFQVREKRIGFLSYNLTFPEEFWASDTSAGTCFPYKEFVFSDVAALKAQVDYVIISCHWGQELLETPKEYQISLAHKLIDNGADLILGHHPHVMQGMEFYKGKLIAYSLGNFIFGSYSESARDSMILKVRLSDAGVMLAEIVPINVYNKEVDFRPLPLAGAEKERFIEKITRLSLELNDTPIGISSDGLISVLAK